MVRRIFFRQRTLSYTTGSLQNLIATSDTPDLCASTSFVASALRAAKDSRVPLRRTILSDVASVLSCSADELGFLFNEPIVAANDSDPVAMPDYRDSLRDNGQAVRR